MRIQFLNICISHFLVRMSPFCARKSITYYRELIIEIYVEHISLEKDRKETKLIGTREL